LREEGPTPGGPPGAPRGPGGGGQTALAAPRARTSPLADGFAQPKSFDDLARLAEDRRDLSLKFDLERYARPISFRAGAVVFEAAPGAPSNLSQRLVARLKEWTGQAWLVACEGAGGGDTLLERQKRADARAQKEVLAEPLVQAVLAAFPGTEILEIRHPTVAEPTVEDGEPSDED
jgi:DNA polymerase-3 subunit gamma/tau